MLYLPVCLNVILLAVFVTLRAIYSWQQLSGPLLLVSIHTSPRPKLVEGSLLSAPKSLDGLYGVFSEYTYYLLLGFTHSSQ